MQERKKEASCQSAEPLKCLDWHRDLWVFSRLFRWVQPCLQSMALGLHLLFCPNLGKRGSSHWSLYSSYDPAHYGFFYLSPGSRLPTGPFSTFISALWGTWALLLSLCTLQSSWETRTIHQLTSELFTYLPSYCCCINLCHLLMAMNKASSSMPGSVPPMTMCLKCLSSTLRFPIAFSTWGLTSRGIKGVKAFVFDLFTFTVSLFSPAVLWSGRSKL